MRVLVTGGAGFIGRAIVEALLDAGHEVVACCRTPGDILARPRLDVLALDLCNAVTADAWLARLDGVGAVVNAAGILREPRRGDFERIHCAAPLALASACRLRGGIRFVQVSALGEAADGEFIRSKHRFDDALLAMDPGATVIRPSVVVSTRGSHGGTSLLRALAALPLVVPVPGAGTQEIQPILLEDLAAVVVRCVQRGDDGPRLLHAVGPEVMSIRDYLLATRRWLGLPPARVVHVPAALVAISVLDLVLAAALLFASRRRPLVLRLMLVSVLAYTLGIGLLAPALWLDPLGGLLKNLAVLGLLLVALAIEDAR